MEKNRIIAIQARIIIGLMISCVVFLFLLAAVSIWGSGRKEVPIHCSDFATQADAQATFISDKVKYAYLDRNHDGIACNDDPKK